MFRRLISNVVGLTIALAATSSAFGINLVMLTANNGFLTSSESTLKSLLQSAGYTVNTLWDGLFHVFAWVAVVAGVAVLYARVSSGRGRVWTSRALWGWVIAGWGLFDLVEGLVDHQILGIHHVRSGPHELWYDLGFLAFGAALLVGGWLLQRGARLPAA